MLAHTRNFRPLTPVVESSAASLKYAKDHISERVGSRPPATILSFGLRCRRKRATPVLGCTAAPNATPLYGRLADHALRATPRRLAATRSIAVTSGPRRE